MLFIRLLTDLVSHVLLAKLGCFLFTCSRFWQIEMPLLLYSMLGLPEYICLLFAFFLTFKCGFCFLYFFLMKITLVFYKERNASLVISYVIWISKYFIFCSLVKWCWSTTKVFSMFLWKYVCAVFFKSLSDAMQHLMIKQNSSESFSEQQAGQSRRRSGDVSFSNV